MEGINFGAMFLVFLGILVLGIAFLVSLGLAIAHKTVAARITLAAGLMCTLHLTALAALSFLQRGMGFYEEGSDLPLVLLALTLFLAGTGQFLAALRGTTLYVASIACALSACLILAFPGANSDVVQLAPSFVQIFGVRTLSAPLLRLGLVVSLLLGVASMMLPLVRPPRRNAAFFGLVLTAFCGIAGFAAGDACVQTECIRLQSFPGGYPQRVRVSVDVLGRRVSEETGYAHVPRQGLDFVRAVSLGQAAWAYGPPLLGLFAGLGGTAVVTRRLVKRVNHDGHVQPNQVGSE